MDWFDIGTTGRTEAHASREAEEKGPILGVTLAQLQQGIWRPRVVASGAGHVGGKPGELEVQREVCY